MDAEKKVKGDRLPKISEKKEVLEEKKISHVKNISKMLEEMGGMDKTSQKIPVGISWVRNANAWC